MKSGFLMKCYIPRIGMDYVGVSGLEPGTDVYCPECKLRIGRIKIVKVPCYNEADNIPLILELPKRELLLFLKRTADCFGNRPYFAHQLLKHFKKRIKIGRNIQYLLFRVKDAIGWI